MPALEVGGLVSGMDTNNIVAQLTKLEQQKVVRELKKKDNYQNTLDKFKELEGKLNNLALTASQLHLPKNFNFFKATSSAEDYVTVTGSDGGVAGKYEVSVHQLATYKKVASKAFSAMNEGLAGMPAGGGTIFLSTSEEVRKKDFTKREVEVKISASDTLKDIANKINSAEGSGVKASLMTDNGEYRLVLTAVDSGTNSFYIRENAVSGGNPTTILGDVLGILDDSKGAIKSGVALTLKNGGAATLDDTFKDINTKLDKNTINNGDVFGIKVYNPKLPLFEDDGVTPRLDADGNQLEGGHEWITADLFDGSGNARKIKDVLNEINGKLDGIYGAGIVEAKLNSSGEIIFEYEKEYSNGNGASLGFADKSEVQFGIHMDDGLRIGSFNAADESFDPEATSFKTSFGSVNVFSTEIGEAKNAFYSVDGISISSQSNDDDKFVPGTTFNLKKTTSGMDPVKISLDIDMEGLADKISAFMEELNEVLKFIDENTRATIIQKTDEVTGIKTNEREVAAFTGDSSIASLRDKIKAMFTGMINELTGIPQADALGISSEDYEGYKTSYSTASRIGIMTTRDGYLSLDREKLMEALTSDIDGVRRLFCADSFSDDPGVKIGNFSKKSESGVYQVNPATGEVWRNGVLLKSSVLDNLITLENGITFEVPSNKENKIATVSFSRGIANQLTNFMETSRDKVLIGDKWHGGFWEDSKDRYQRRIEDQQKRADQLQASVDRYNARLKAQFVGLEKNMGNLQSQSANMISALSSLTYGNNNK